MSKRIRLPALGGGGDARHSQEYRDYLDSPAWRRRRTRLLQQRGLACEDCGTTGVQLQLHHLTYDRLGNEDDEDLILLCSACHGDADEERAEQARFESALQTYIDKKYTSHQQVAPHNVREEFAAWLQRKQQEQK